MKLAIAFCICWMTLSIVTCTSQEMGQQIESMLQNFINQVLLNLQHQFERCQLDIWKILLKIVFIFFKNI